MKGSVMDLAIKNARVVTEEGVIRGGIAVEGGKIAFVGADIPITRC